MKLGVVKPMRTWLFSILFLLATVSIFSQKDLRISSAEITFNFLNNDVDGSISGFRSTSDIDLENPANSTFEGSVRVETIKTGNFLRDWSLKGRKYFDADEYPQITFRSTEVTATTNGLKVEGSLTIKGTSKPITIDFKKNGNRLTGTTTLFSSDYGIHIKKRREQNKVTVNLAFEVQ